MAASSLRRSTAEKCEPSANDDDAEEEAGTSAMAQLRENTISLSTLNPYITCSLCNGYFVDATTVLDCLHTFCKSCLLKHFEDNTDCPKCHYQIHQSHPSNYVAFDRTMQDIVYKLVPGMQPEEQRRREQFKQRQRAKEAREQLQQEENGHANGGNGGGEAAAGSSSDSGFSNCSNSNGEAAFGVKLEENGDDDQLEHGVCCPAGQDPTTAHRRDEEPVLIQLLPDDKFEPLERPLVRLSVFATVNTVKRLLAYLLFGDITKYNEFDLFCNEELMGRDFSMAFIKKTRWRNRPEPVMLMYKERLDF